jgi:hypothetical protein
MERMFVQLAGFDAHPLLGLPLNQSKILPGGDRQQQERHGKRRGEKSAQRPSQCPLRPLSGYRGSAGKSRYVAYHQLPSAAPRAEEPSSAVLTRREPRRTRPRRACEVLSASAAEATSGQDVLLKHDAVQPAERQLIRP